MKTSATLLLATFLASIISANLVAAQQYVPQQTASDPYQYSKNSIPSLPGGLSPDQDIANPNWYHANPVIAWNAFSTSHFYKPFSVQNAHQLAELTAAVHDALNTVQQRYDFFLGSVASQTKLPPNRIQQANLEAVVAGVYTSLFPVLYADLQYWQLPIAAYVYDPNDLPGWNAEVNNFWQWRNYTLQQNIAAQYKYDTKQKDPHYATNYNNQIAQAQQPINDGFLIGQTAAAAIHAARAYDGHNLYAYYSPQPPSTTNPMYLGLWKTATGRTGAVPVPYAQYADVKPFAIDAITNYQAPPPPKLSDPQYVADILEVMYQGTNGQGLFSITPTSTPDQQNLASWVTGIGAEVVSNLYLQYLLARDFAGPGGVATDLWASARVFALTQLAVIDANIVNQYNKRKHNFWRPRDALISTIPVYGPCTNNGDGTQTCDPGISAFSPGGQNACGQPPSNLCWIPYIQNNPSVDTVQVDPSEVNLPQTTTDPTQYTGENTAEWPAGVTTQIAAAAEVLAIALLNYGNQPKGINTTFHGGPLSIQYNSNIPAISFSSFADVKALSVNAAVYSGQHIRSSANVGVTQGTFVAREVYANALQKPGFGRQPRWFDVFFNAFTW